VSDKGGSGVCPFWGPTRLEGHISGEEELGDSFSLAGSTEAAPGRWVACSAGLQGRFAAWAMSAQPR
jgi:hypothetical protein